MSSLIYLRLFGFTAGTLLQLFWIVLILGYRRRRNLERVLFFLALALFLFYSGSLLALNAQIHYAQPPSILLSTSLTLIAAGLCFLPPLIVHVHTAYSRAVEGKAAPPWFVWITVATYIPVPYFVLVVIPQQFRQVQSALLWPGHSLGASYGAWLAGAMLVAVYFEDRFARQTQIALERTFHRAIQIFFGIAAPFIVYTYAVAAPWPEPQAIAFGTVLMLASLLPSAFLSYFVLRYNFLQIGRQHNLVYAVSSAFLALLYLGAVRRVSVWLEPLLPPEATAAILLFTLVIFFEPLQRWVSKLLRDLFQMEVDRLQRLLGQIQQEARHGDLARLVLRTEGRLQEEFGLAAVRLRLRDGANAFKGTPPLNDAPRSPASFPVQTFLLKEGAREIGILEVTPHGAAPSGETRGALEFLSEQLPGVLDLCRLIEQKVALERELAERERMALVGQMAASISHNLKNPLSSMKTILQVQLENPALPKDVRSDCNLVVAEIDRLASKLGQLLSFSKPVLRGGDPNQSVAVRTVAENVANLLRHEADRRGVTLELDVAGADCHVRGNEAALNDVLTNLLVNAIEAVNAGGRVRVSFARRNGFLKILIEDNGSGIPPDLQKKIFEPFFTTKSQGTGLGLGIVARRVSEMSGEISWRSPVSNGRGTQFAVDLPIMHASSPLQKETGSEKEKGVPR